MRYAFWFTWAMLTGKTWAWLDAKLDKIERKRKCRGTF